MADNIIVLYRASVAEAGGVERVVKAPQHPYTQLLIASIPQVSTDRGWLSEQEAKQRTVVGNAGCKFLARCPVAMPICHQSVPPLFRTESRRFVACHHYPDAGNGQGAALETMFDDRTS